MRILRTGSDGAAVQLLQLALNRTGAGELETDGVFGAATAAALRRFQREQGLNPDGVAGACTHRALQPWYTGYRRHTIRRGDTLWALARRYGTSLAAIDNANPGRDPENLPVGGQLVIPLPFPVVPTGIDYSSELVAFCVQGLAARYPFLAAGELGHSAMGKPIWTLRLGGGRNRVLYHASHHANEWITTPLLLHFAEQLCAALVSGESLGGLSAGELLNDTDLVLVPAVNPDGIDLVTGELRQGPWFEQAQRIARAWPSIPFPAGWKANLQGVDLNLQYPAGWEQARENKFALGVRAPAPANFVGTAPLTAPESRALYDFTLAFSPALTLAYHSQGEVIYWKYLDYAPPESAEIVRRFAAVSGYTAEDTPYAAGFAGYKDFFLQDFRRPGFTVEVGRGVNPLPLSQFEEIWRDNLGILSLGLVST